MQALGSHSTISDLVGSQNYLHIIICKESSTEEPRPKLTLAIFIHGLFFTDRFSEFRCNKALPLALAAYKEGLPSHYREEYHKAKV